MEEGEGSMVEVDKPFLLPSRADSAPIPVCSISLDFVRNPLLCSLSVDASSPSSRLATVLSSPHNGISSRQSKRTPASFSSSTALQDRRPSQAESLSHPEEERCWRLTDGGDSCPAAILRVPTVHRKTGGLKALLGTGVVSTTSQASASQPVFSQSPRLVEPSLGVPPRDPELTRPPQSTCIGNVSGISFALVPFPPPPPSPPNPNELIPYQSARG
ncbi:unnamed protein product [Schistocephalus solidus]|uniref:Uncharacterized protein n=1 Tax=Schistocephalus solidus TaxID=70667 RepID=A0A183SFX7_SCHSO|nr:unnamed protein product [Schistocephalus solidus]